MITLTSTEPFIVPHPATGEEMLVDPVARTYDVGNGPLPLPAVFEKLIPSEAQIEVAAERLTATEAIVDDAEVLRQALFDHTELIIAWNTAAQTYLNTAGASGALNIPLFISLLGDAEELLVECKNFPTRVDSVLNQRDWMLQRGQQAQSILALAAVLG